MSNTLAPIKLNNRSLYDRAIDALVSLINDRQYKPGDRLPSENQLSEQLGISRTTLREATSFLERQGIVSRKHGLGTFVLRSTRQALQGGLDELVSMKALAKKIGKSYQRLLWQVTEVQAPADVSASLQIEPLSTLTRVQMVVAMDGQVFAYLDSYIITGLTDIDKLRSYPEGSYLDFLLERKELGVSHTYSQIFAIAATQEIAQMMAIPLGAPLLHLIETYQTPQGQPLVQTFNYFGTDVMNFYINRRIIPL